ncbi:MAG: sigma-70 family RNA polymerase sigma factor [Bacteroidota bacterium]|nr:sigma-70 family RNA polymerase sigma factor [Bacteroidota bacterium]
MKVKRFTVALSEEELVFRLKSRDVAAFEALYDNYSDTLYGIILKVVRADPPAADVLQEAFMKIWNNIESYDRSKGTIFTWTLNISRNLAIDKIRSASYRKAKDTLDTEKQLGLIDKTMSTESRVEYIGLKDYVDKMKPEHQQLVDMIYFGGYTQAEVSKQLNIPVGTIKTRIKQALLHLKEVFGNELGK